MIKRTDVYELIEYAPQTETVREIPLLFVPPTINKFYVLDLAPGRSMVEYLVQQGQRVFMISWRNPGDAHGHFDFDTYAAAILEARDAVAKRTRRRPSTSTPPAAAASSVRPRWAPPAPTASPA